MKTLSLSFKGSLGKGPSLKLTYANDGVTDHPVRDAMNKIVESKVFQKDDDLLYLKAMAAKYVTTTDEVIFDSSQD